MEKLTNAFTYDEFTTRNFGFVDQAEQDKLKASSVFVCGVGGMGGACLQALARSGIGHFIIADMDVFELSNLNRQVFANLGTVDKEKTRATETAILNINPEAKIDVYDGSWPDHLNGILDRVDIVVNGMDDVAETINLYRQCRLKKLTIIDAYAASLPSVYVTRAGKQTPEERLNYPTKGRPRASWTEEDFSEAFLRELEFVMGCSSSRKYIDMEAGAEMAAGKRSRMSFASMVILTGNMMSYEVINALLDRPSGADNRGYFFNPHTGRTERPPIKPVEWLLRRLAGRAIAKLMD
ncbi:E1 enzyme family [Chondrus crispus]|uniref:E1 enzyme family n=1 Tax=Chondrus crispus TaxID=2769 RepID=R7QSD0_CHOCR|nr:E1 enzyme family [Chondrus crispus]CDF40421.1 E1 enzyme family [Chondrus crispus]|eukprot:XP_005710715.1 E1 enzyme family [Chondrus crispus]